MDLDFSNRGLFAFDAAKAQSALAGAATRTSTDTATGGAAPPAVSLIHQLNLSYNALHLFTGGETLRGLTVLDLSHNALTQLFGQSMPPTLTRLNVSHNKLAQLGNFSACMPRLQVLEAGHNQLTTSALRDLPPTLTHLSVEANAIESLHALGALVRLSSLNVAHNLLDSRDTLPALRPLVSLRQLDLRGNPMCVSTSGDRSRLDGGAAAATAAGLRAPAEQGDEEAEAEAMAVIASVLRDVLPRLARLNNTALSQAPESRMCKTAAAAASSAASRAAVPRQRHAGAPSGRSGSREGRPHSGHSLQTSSLRQQQQAAPALEVRLMQAKVRELRRLLLAAQDAEGKARHERGVLAENVKSTAKVMAQQEAELTRLQTEVASLRAEDQRLRLSVVAAEQTFEQVHASLLASKAKMSAGAA